jgi:hypothetical protein
MLSRNTESEGFRRADLGSFNSGSRGRSGVYFIHSGLLLAQQVRQRNHLINNLQNFCNLASYLICYVADKGKNNNLHSPFKVFPNR